MPTMEQHHSAQYLKLCLYAESGTGKTGALAALANAGYKLAILDFDNGLDVLMTYTRPECLKNIHYVTLQDEMEVTSVMHGKLKAKQAMETLSPSQLHPPTAYPKALKLLNRWREKEVKDKEGNITTPAVDLGKTQHLGEDWFVVIDSMTMLGRWMMFYVQARAGHDTIWRGDWGVAMEMQENLTQLVCSSNYKTNVIVNAHVKTATAETDEKGNVVESKSDRGEIGHKYPSWLGSTLPPKAQRYFNNALTLEEQTGTGKREIKTFGVQDMTLKSTAPKALDKKYPLKLDAEGYAIEGLAAVVSSIKAAMQVAPAEQNTPS